MGQYLGHALSALGLIRCRFQTLPKSTKTLKIRGLALSDPGVTSDL